MLGGAVLLFAFRAFLFGGQSLVGYDLPTFALPQHQLISRLIAERALPAWNPAMGLGAPLIGDASLPLFYPPCLLHALFEPVTALNLFLLLHLMIGLCGVFFLARDMESELWGAGLAALAFGCGGVALSQLGTPMYASGAAWVPWAVLAHRRALTGPFSSRRLVLSALPFALIFLSGAVEYTLIAALLAVLLGAVEKKQVKRGLLTLLGSAALAIGLCGLAIGPAIYVVLDSGRAAGLDPSESATWSLSLYELLSFIVARPFQGEGAISPEALNNLADRPWFASLHLGVLPLVLLVLGAARVKSDRRARVLVITAGLFFVLALGRFTPLYALLSAVPGAGAMRYPAKLALGMSLALALLAARAWSMASKDESDISARPALRLGLTVVFVIAAVTALLAWSRGLGALRVRASLSAAAALLALLWSLFGKDQDRARGLIALTAIELALASTFLLDFAPRAILAEEPAFLEALAREEERTGLPTRVGRLPSVPLTLAPGAGLDLSEKAALGNYNFRQTLAPNVGMAYGARGDFAFHPLIARRAARWSLASKALRVAPGADVMGLYRRQGLTHLLATEYDNADQVAALVPIDKAGPWVLGRIKSAAPWAAVYGAPRCLADEDAAFKAVFQYNLDPRQSVVAELAEAPESWTERGLVGSVQIEEKGPDRLRLAVEARAPGLLVLRDATNAGWSAAVSGEARPVIPVDALFRGVAVPAGRSEVVFEYRARGWTAGWITSLLAALVSAALVLADRRLRSLFQRAPRPAAD